MKVLNNLKYCIAVDSIESSDVLQDVIRSRPDEEIDTFDEEEEDKYQQDGYEVSSCVFVLQNV